MSFIKAHHQHLNPLVSVHPSHNIPSIFVNRRINEPHKIIPTTPQDFKNVYHLQLRGKGGLNSLPPVSTVLVLSTKILINEYIYRSTL